MKIVSVALAAILLLPVNSAQLHAAENQSAFEKKAKPGTAVQDAQLPSQTMTSFEQRQPRFIVEAIGFIARDESGVDFPGSDEVRTFFYTTQSEPDLAVSQKFDDVDTGEEREFGEQEKCILPRKVLRNVGDRDVLQAPKDAWICGEEGVAGPLSFTVAMYEDDPDGFIVSYGRYCFAAYKDEIEGRDCQDDLIGSETVTYSVAELLEMMPRVDNTFVGTVTLGGPCGHGNRVCAGWLSASGPEYLFGFRITRLPDRLLPPQLSK